MPRQTLKRRPDGRFACKYKGIFFYGETQKEALQKREEYKRMEGQGIDKKDIPFKAYAAKWLSVYKTDCGDKTYNSYALYIDKINELFPGKTMREFTSSDIREIYNLYSGKSVSQIKKIVMTTKSIFDAAVADGIINRSPCLNVQRPSGTEGTHRALERWEIQMVNDMVKEDHRFSLAAMLMLYGGLRKGEMLAFNIDRDVDFGNDIIYVREAVHFLSNQPILGGPKSRAGVRQVPLLKPLKEALQGHHGLVLTNRSGEPASDTVFNVAFNSYKVAIEQKLNGSLKRWYRSDKPWKECTIRAHDFRHTFCTMCYEAGVDLKTCMLWMGHADEKMIMKIYAHLTKQKEAASAANMAKLVNNMFGSQNGSQK